MYNVTIKQSALVNYFSEINILGEMIKLYSRSFLNFANRLCSFEKRLTSYQDHKGFSWIENHIRPDVTSDFYSYIKENQRHITAELSELNLEFENCRIKAVNLLDQFAQNERTVLSPLKPEQNHGKIIQFPKQQLEDEKHVRLLTVLLSESEQLSRDVNEQLQIVSTKADSLVTQMRGQLRA